MTRKIDSVETYIATQSELGQAFCGALALWPEAIVLRIARFQAERTG